MLPSTWIPNLWAPGSKNRPRPAKDEYALLPSVSRPRSLSTTANDHRFRRRRTCSCRPLSLFSRQRFGLRRLLTFAALVLALLVSAILVQGVPPSFNDIRVYEDRLPQHRLVPRRALPWHPPGAGPASDPRPGHGPPGAETETEVGQSARYIRFPGSLWGFGLNNVLQEALVLSYLAHASNLSYVFEDYTWSRSPLPWTLYDFALRPTRMPLNAFISGPTAGGPLPSDDRAPRAVSAQHWEAVCGGGVRVGEGYGEETREDGEALVEEGWMGGERVTLPARKKIRVLTSKGAPYDAEGSMMIEWWRSRLSRVEEPCIEIDSSEHDLFDRFLFGGPRFLSILDPLLSSPILTGFSWSPLVHAALLRNSMLFQDTSSSLYASIQTPHSYPTQAPASDALSSPSPFTEVTSAIIEGPAPFLSGLLAVHLRRGDYVRHCPNLATWGADYMGVNQHPSLPDRFTPDDLPVLDGALSKDRDSSAQKEQRKAYYLEHCLPSDEELVRRLREVRAAYRSGVQGRGGKELNRVYVLSNDGAWALESLRTLLEADGWEDVVASHDLVLDAEQRYVSVGVDMAIAERAEVFVGNGFSSLSSNVVMLRMARGMPAESNRFL